MPNPTDGKPGVAAVDAAAQQGQVAQATDFSPITSQDELNRVIGERIQRERAKYADHDDLKAKAARLDEIEAANKTEIEKAREQVEAAQAEAGKVPNLVAGSLRDHLVKLHKISDDDAELFLTATDPEVLLKQVDGLVARTKSPAGVVPSQGTGDPATARASSYETGRERGLARYQKSN